METAKRIFRRSVDTMYALSSFFIDNFINCAARVTISIPWPDSIIISFSTPSSIHDKINHFGLNEIKKWLTEYLAAVRLKELNAYKEAPATTVACEETAQQAETAALSEVNPHAPLSVMCPSL